MKISKELVSEVFKLNICEAYIENNNLYFDMELPLIQRINLYEFAFKCKEWAYINDYNVIDYKIGKKELDVFIIKADKNDFNKVEKIFYHNSTLVEGAIKACEWILEQNKKDNQWLYYQYGELNGVAAGIDAGAIYNVIVIYFYLGKKKWN